MTGDQQPQPTTATVNGLPVIVGVNAYIKPE